MLLFQFDNCVFQIVTLYSLICTNVMCQWAGGGGRGERIAKAVCKFRVLFSLIGFPGLPFLPRVSELNLPSSDFPRFEHRLLSHSWHLVLSWNQPRPLLIRCEATHFSSSLIALDSTLGSTIQVQEQRLVRHYVFLAAECSPPALRCRLT